jgi:hypothetical protein
MFVSLFFLLCLTVFLTFPKTRQAVFWSLSLARPSFTAKCLSVAKAHFPSFFPAISWCVCLVFSLLCLAIFLRFQKTREAVFWSLSLKQPSFTAMAFRRGEGSFA